VKNSHLFPSPWLSILTMDCSSLSLLYHYSSSWSLSSDRIILLKNNPFLRCIFNQSQF
ncbi:unnamed protein product, partial [Bubo scandiacus]